MGTFKDTNYSKTIDSLVQATKDKLVNPYYAFSDKKPTKVIYYCQNLEKSTTDEASELYESHVGRSSPLKFNKIIDFYLYGIEKVITEFGLTENGIEANDITGECIVLPNTISPKPGDFFSIPYVKEDILFKVNDVTPDTLSNGSNIYRVQYALELTDKRDSIEAQVVKTFRFLTGNIGTDFKTVLEDCDYELGLKLESIIGELKTFMTNVFFDSKLQTFVFNHDGWHIYDPFMIEFLIRNKILGGTTCVFHATALNKTFSMDYMKSFFYFLEHPEDGTERFRNEATADIISDPNSLFVTRLDDYYEIRVNDKTPYKTRLQLIDPDVVEHIRKNERYEQANPKEFYNLWIDYFNGSDVSINTATIDLVRSIDVLDNLACFYSLPITIFVLEQFITKLLKRTS